MSSGVYEIVNSVNGKRYVGSTMNLKKRRRNHLSRLRHNNHSNPHLQAAFCKYGEAAFLFSLLEPTEISMLIEREQHYLDTLKPEYNTASTAGRPMLGRHHSPETRAKMSSAHNTRRPHTAETRAKMSAAQMGHPVSAETRTAGRAETRFAGLVR